MLDVIDKNWHHHNLFSNLAKHDLQCTVWEFQKQKYENLTNSMVLWMNEEAQLLGVSVLPPPAKKQAFLSSESYVDETLNIGSMSHNQLPTNWNEYLSLMCTTNEATTVKRVLQVVADIRFQTYLLVEQLMTSEKGDGQKVHNCVLWTTFFTTWWWYYILEQLN